MTAEELKLHFNRVFGLNEWPKTYEVDAITYANCCQIIFNWKAKNEEVMAVTSRFNIYTISLGNETNGLMFKNVELILKP